MLYTGIVVLVGCVVFVSVTLWTLVEYDVKCARVVIVASCSLAWNVGVTIFEMVQILQKKTGLK